MKNYCYYEEKPHFDMNNMNFEEINIHQNCNFNPIKRPCGCSPMPPMPYQPIRPPQNYCCYKKLMWLVGGIVIGKLLD